MMTTTRAFLFGCAALLLAGCNGATTALPQTQAGDPQLQAEFQLLADIPILAGASMDNDRSLILGDRDRWTGRVVMKVSKTSLEATNFYQQQMPQFGWEPIMAATSGISVMSYIRGDRAASVQIERGNVWGSTISVIVGPRGGSAAASPAPAPAIQIAPRPAPIQSESLAPPVRR